MTDSKIFIGNTPLENTPKEVKGDYVVIDGQEYYKISNYDTMRPFFMTLVSNSDLWLFISSNGGLSAGRNSPETALFPYYSDDKIADGAEITGSKTILKVTKGNKTFLWEPFSDRFQGIYNISRNIYKNRIGNRLIFEESNENLEVLFRYSWTFSEEFGFVKESFVNNQSQGSISIEFLDGVQNLLPYGVNSSLQNQRSTLVDAYKKNELYDKGIGLFSLSSMIIDRAEPSESLKATSVWSAGVNVQKHLLSSIQLSQFRKGLSISNELDVRAERGAYFINGQLNLIAQESSSWYIVCDINQSMIDVSLLKHHLDTPDSLIELLKTDIKHSENALRKLVGLSDGIQVSHDKLSTGRHFSNVLFNIMRGGVFSDQYTIDTSDLTNYLQSSNHNVFDRSADFINNLDQSISYTELVSLAAKQDDLDLQRLCAEYLPLSFSRRHGDPSRPWNTFQINTPNSKSYEGNWRDIFQNWEALAYSFPEFVEGMIIKFLNASTIDGYNPYRITNNGIDWEVIEEDDPWSYIGYWGDHQIVYLLKLMEISEAHFPGKLANILTDNISVYANVPYKIKGYEDILKDPSDTIDFDHELNDRIEEKFLEMGSDGKLVFNEKGDVLRANLTEKLLVTVLTKLYNFIPEAGIWLNTQRPEWNDANNALVGNGVSMVTLYHLRRFLLLGVDIFNQIDNKSIALNKPVAELLDNLYYSYSSRLTVLEGRFSDSARKEMMDDLGKAGEVYRNKAYDGFDGELHCKKTIDIISMFYVALEFVDHSIKFNSRQDGLYHAYNLIEFNDSETSIKRLYPMLEGQVAVLSSKYLDPQQACDVLNSLKKSAIYREDQYSYMLYPDKDLPLFVDRNAIPAEFIKNSKLANALIDKENTSIIEANIEGNYHFNSSFNNANSLSDALNELHYNGLHDLIDEERSDFLNTFEYVFNHQSFTGRSGTFYGYEGLGSIYWHMVSKLLLATQENIFAAVEKNTRKTVFGNLVDHYYEIRAGIGINKSPDIYGAFPTDAYSHTPGNTGVQQPGMTGQVKEDIINRWAELGVIVENGQILFEPTFLRKEEFLTRKGYLKYYNILGEEKSIRLRINSLAFTYCQVPIIYQLSDSPKMEVYFVDGSIEQYKSNVLSKEISSDIFSRSYNIDRIICNQLVLD